MAQKKEDGRTRKRTPLTTGGRRKSCFFCKSKVDEITRNVELRGTGPASCWVARRGIVLVPSRGGRVIAVRRAVQPAAPVSAPAVAAGAAA